MGAVAGAPPRILGRYALYAEIASGGMATVHLGRLLGASGFTKTVAIKSLHPQFAKDPDFVDMFLDEAQLAARIQHPNVVSTLDVVALEGALFLVMEYVQGESLSRLARMAKQAGLSIPPEIAVSVVVGALHGLHAAHEAVGVNGEPLEIVHRDVSPQNILVGKDGATRVLDFGVAKAATRTTQTKDGVVKGKLAYMAPEQFSGQTTRATDVYAASIVLWETLVGRRLFRGENDAQTMKLVLDGKADPPSKLVPGVPPAIDAIVLRGLAKDPAERYATAREMARALEKALPLASPSDVAEFVAILAGPALAERARLVAQIESGVVPVDATAVIPGPTSSPSFTRENAHDTSGPAGADPLTQMESISDGLPEVARTSRLRRAVAVVAVASAAFAVIVALVVRAGRAPPPSPTTHVAETPPSALPDIPPPPPSVTTPSVAQSAPPVAHQTASVAPPPLPSPSPKRVSPPARAPARAAAAPNCNPPFTIDAEGIRHYKRECE